MGKSVRGTTSNDPWLSAIKDDISTPTATAAATPSASKKSSAPAADPWLSAVADDIKKKVGTTDGSNGSTPPAPSPSPSPSETGATFDNAYNIATLNGVIQPEGTFKPKPSPVKDLIEQMKEQATVENGVATIHDNSQPKSNLPDIKEAIDSAVQQKIKRDRGVDLKTPPSKYEVESATKVVTDAYKRGDLVPKVENGKAVMKRGTGFVESVLNSVDETYRANQENEYFSNLSKEEKIKYLNLNQQYPEVFQPQPETAPSGIGGQFGAFVGENASMLSKGAVGGIAAAEAAPIVAASSFGLIGTAGASNFGSFVALANDFGKSGYKAGYEKAYYALKQQGLSDEEAADKAEKVGLTGEATQLGVSAVLSAAPKIDLQATEPAVSGFIDGLVKSAGGMLKKEAPKMAATSAGASLAESGAEAAVGVDVDPKKALEEAVQAGGHGALIGAAFWALHEPLRIPSYLRPQAENLLATVPVEAREDYLNKAVEQGISTEEQKIAVSKTINELGEKKTAVNDLPIPEEKKAAIAGKLVQAERLEREKDELSKYGSSFNDKIGQIDAQISNIHEDINKMYGADDVFEHESDSLTGEKPTVKGEPENISQPIELNPEITSETAKNVPVKTFEDAGNESKSKQDASILGGWILDNSKEGDTITDKGGNGYEVSGVKTRKDGVKEVVVTPFEIDENGNKDYNHSGLKLISDNNKKAASDLFETSYTNSNGKRVTEQYKYNPNGENQTATTTGDSTGQATDTSKESKTLPSNESPTPQETTTEVPAGSERQNSLVEETPPTEETRKLSIQKYSKEGNNEVLAGDDARLAEARIEKIISTSKTLEEAKTRIGTNAANYVFNFGRDTALINKFIQDRIDGKTNETFAEWRSKPEEIKPTVDESQAQSTEKPIVKADEGTTVSNEPQPSKESSPVETATGQDKQGAKQEKPVANKSTFDGIVEKYDEWKKTTDELKAKKDNLTKEEIDGYVKKSGYKLIKEGDKVFGRDRPDAVGKYQKDIGGKVIIKTAEQIAEDAIDNKIKSFKEPSKPTPKLKEYWDKIDASRQPVNQTDNAVANEASGGKTGTLEPATNAPEQNSVTTNTNNDASISSEVPKQEVDTPVKNEYKARVDNLDKDNKQSDVSQLKEGDYVNVPRSDKSSGVTGFVKKVGRTNVVVDTFYQLGSTADDGIMQDITVKKADIKEFIKPKNNNDAIQEQKPAESVLRNQRVRGEGELQGVEQDNKPEVAPQESKPKKKVSRTKLSASIMSKADTIEKEGILPSWLKVHLPEGTQQAGFGEKELTKAFTSAMRLTAKAIDGGAALVESINEGVEHLRGVFSDNKLPFDEAAIRKGLKSEVKKLLSGKPELEFTSVRKEKLKEIEGVKKEFAKRSPISWNETYDNALRKVQEAYPNKSLYDAVRSRVNEFVVRLNNKDLFNPTSEDIAVFNVFRNQTQKRINDIEGMDSDNQVQRLAAVAEFEPLQEDLMNVARVTNPNGEAGRAFGMHQSEVKLDPDYGLKIRRMELMRSKGGEKLSPEDLKQTQEKWEREKEIMKREQEVRDKAMRDDFDARLAELKRQSEGKWSNKSNPQENKAKLTVDKRKSVADFMRKSADKLENFSRAKGIEGAEIAGVDIQKAIADGMRYVADKIEEGKIKIPDIIADAVVKYGKGNEDELRNHIKNELKNAGIDDDLLVNSRESSLDKIKDFSDANKATDITNDMVGKNLIRDFVNSHIGEVDQSEILDTAAKDLKKVLPDVNKKKLIEAYLKEGEFKQPTKKDLEGGMTEAKKQLASISKLTEDIEDLNGLKEIRQRSFSTEREKSEYEKKLSDEKNAKIKEIADRRNKINEENRKLEADRNHQMKRVSELTEKKAKLEKGIIEKTKAAEKRVDTPEIEKLLAEVEAITKEIRKTESDRNKEIRSGNRKVETEINRQMTRISELNDKKAKLEKGIREKRNVTKKVDTPEIEDLKKQVKKVDEDLRKAESEKNRLDKEAQDKKDKLAELDANIKRAKADRDLIKTHKNKSEKQIDAEIEAKQRELKKAVRDNSSEERVQEKKLQDTIKQRKAEIKEFKRKIDADEYDIPVPVKLKIENAELIKLDKEKAIIQGEYRKMQDDYKEKNKSRLERVGDFVRSAYVATLIGHPKTLLKVGALAILRPMSEATSKLTFGKVFDSFFPGISEAAKRGGESSSILSVQKGFEAYLSRLGKDKIEAKYIKSEKEYTDAVKEHQDFKSEVSSIKSSYGENSSEYKAALKKLGRLKDNVNNKLLKAQSNIVYQFIGGSSFKDALGSFVNRSNEIERQFGKINKESLKEAVVNNPEHSDLENIVSTKFNQFQYILGFIGRSHSALKTFSGRFSFAAGFMARMEAAIGEGRDISKTDTMLEIAHESYIDWERGKYQQSNFISDKWNKLINSLEKGETGKELGYSKVAKFILQSDVAITRVPVNVLHEAVMEYTLGAFRAIAMAAKDISAIKKEVTASGLIPDSVDFKAAMREEISQMDAERAASIARAFRKGGLGAGLYALALITGGVKFGIFPHLGQKKKKDERDLDTGELNPGQVQIGSMKMGEISSGVLDHIPALWPMFMGLGMAQSYKDQIQKGKTTAQAVGEAVKVHLQVIEGSIPQTKIISPTAVLTTMTQNVTKRMKDVGMMSDPNKFTDADLKSPAWQLLNDRGLKPPVMQSNNVKLPVSGNKPNRNMTLDEFNKFNEVRKATVEKFVNNAIKSNQKFSGKGMNGVAFYNVPISQMTSDQLKSKLKTWEGNASKVAKAKLLAKK